MRRLLFFLICALCLASCIGIDGAMTIRQDGSGTLALTYRIAQTVADLGRSGSEKGPLPLPVSREDFERGLAGVRGVELRSFARTENEIDITIKALIAFDSLEALSKASAFFDAPPSVSTQGTLHTFTQPIVKAAEKEVSQDSLAMLDAFFDGYSITLSFEAPTAITSHSVGSLSADRKTLTFTSSVKDLVTTRKDISVSFAW